MTEDEMVGWHHQLNGHEFEQGVGRSCREELLPGLYGPRVNLPKTNCEASACQALCTTLCRGIVHNFLLECYISAGLIPNLNQMHHILTLSE